MNGKWYLHTNTYTLIQLDAHIRVQPMEGRAPEREDRKEHTQYTYTKFADFKPNKRAVMV